MTAAVTRKWKGKSMIQHYERDVRSAPADCRCSECNAVVKRGERFARIRVNLWGRLWRTLACCVDCCRKSHTGAKPFNDAMFETGVSKAG